MRKNAGWYVAAALGGAAAFTWIQRNRARIRCQRAAYVVFHEGDRDTAEREAEDYCGYVPPGTLFTGGEIPLHE